MDEVPPSVGWTISRQTWLLEFPGSSMHEGQEKIGTLSSRQRRSADKAAQPEEAEARTKRLNDLREAIRDGRYSVSAEDVAQRLLRDLKRRD